MASIDAGNTTGTSGNDYSGALSSLTDILNSRHSNSGWAQGQLNTQLGNIASQFNTSFTNMVGRAPTQAETNQFLSQAGANTLTTATGGLVGNVDQTQLGNLLNSYVGQNFQGAAKDYATQQLQQQQAGWNTLADSSLSQGNDAISATEKSLQDYQSNLFDRLRPNLLTSLKAQGLLDTGGLNEAVAGVQGDLANNASQYIAGLTLQNQQNANQIRLSGQAAPLQFQQNNSMNQPGLALSQGNAAGNFNNNTFMQNLAYQQQLGLIGAQANANASLRPSFLRTMGQGFAGSFGQESGKQGSQMAQAGLMQIL